MRALVLDGSAALAFLLADERAPVVGRALDALERGAPTFVPSHWMLEVANGLLVAERRRRISRADTAEAIEVLRQLPVDVDPETSRRAGGETAGLARQYALSVYDAAYLELALRRGAALATTDAALARAATRAGVPVL
jgi:predicted nucleic acid-binding protein